MAKLLCVTCAVCEQPAVSVMVRSCHVCVTHSGFLSHQHCTLTVALHRLSIRGHSVLVKYLNVLIENFWYMAARKQASKQASIHTHVSNAVTLVWGSLRLAPIKWNKPSPSFCILSYYKRSKTRWCEGLGTRTDNTLICWCILNKWV